MKIELTALDIGDACMCHGVRKAARQLARRYDDAFRPIGITSGQFSILAAMLRDAAVPLGDLAELLGLDRTTLTRNLKPLEAEGLVSTVADDDDRRVRGLRLTEKGRSVMSEAIPLWRTAQQESARRLGKADWPAFRSVLQALG